MIQLRRAAFKNFRLLRDVTFEFSTSNAQRLTVIRAENDTGKTTLLNALGWALFGDSTLPASRSAYRLHPIDWNAKSDGPTVPIKVSIEFSTYDEETDSEVVYELERSCEEQLLDDTRFSSSPSNLILLQHSSAGMRPIEDPEAILNSVLPSSLKDIFFIDGDRALAFIEATDEQRVKRDRVARAIRSLLGLDLLENAERHVDKARQEAVSAIRKLGAGTDIERLAQLQEEREAESAELQSALDQYSRDRDATEDRQRKANKRLREALAAGAGEHRDVGNQLATAERQLDEAREGLNKQLVAHRRLINSSMLTVALAPAPISVAAKILAELEDRKVIPSTLPNVIEDRLARGECICGTSLAQGTTAREHLESLLDEARDIDEAKDLLRYLNDAVKRSLRELSSEDSWSVRLKESQREILRTSKLIAQLEGSVTSLRLRVREMDSTDLEQLESIVSQEEREVKRLLSEIGRTEQKLKQVSVQLKDVQRDRANAEKANSKVKAGVAKERAAKDVLAVVRNTVGVLQGETVDEVSQKMNAIFLAMIVADEDAGSVVRRVTLTREHDIVVEGPEGRKIDPDIDLNGASRRALTLAFILALVEVSGYEAPLIIDTPLGMMGVEVRRAVLQYAAVNSSQLVMFLTGSEVLGVEDLLDKFAGRVYTLTNAAHYPTKLLNDPGTDRTETLVCECNHRQSCPLCIRRIGSASSAPEVSLA